MKKIFNVLLSVCLLVSCFVIPETASAKTLRDLYKELDAVKEKYKANKDKEKLTNQQIAAIKTNISNINAKMAQIDKDIIRLNEEIQKLNEEITEKDKEIKDIINFLQLSNGESAYLEYAFGAKDFTDFIYRVAITEQMTEYNDKLIAEYNQMIEDNIKKGQELKIKEENLKTEQKNLEVQLSKLGNQLVGIYEISVDLEDAIREQENFIKSYEDIGCGLDEDLNTCSQIPPDNAFWRPLASGIVTSNFGWRQYWLDGALVEDHHHGIDLGQGVGTPIYATANGLVSGVTNVTGYPKNSTCGGNTVYIYHNIKGEIYTSQYMHMYKIYVKVGDIVTKDTIIGTVGGAERETPWDKCSTGSHLHFTLLNGYAGKDYMYWSDTFYAKAFNPAIKVNFPNGYWWTNRTTYY